MRPTGLTLSLYAFAAAPRSGMRKTKPRSYFVWVDTKGHPGDLRGALFAGMAHM